MERCNTELVKKSLRNSRIFGDLGEALLTDIVGLVQVKMVKGGDVLFQQGQPSGSMIVLISGRLLANYTTLDGTVKTIADISPGSSAGELGLILEQPRSASVIAIRDSFVAELTQQCFETLLKNHPIEINRAITRTVFEYNTMLNKKSRIVSATILTFVAAEKSHQIGPLCRELSDSLGGDARVKHLSPEEGQKLYASSSDDEQVSMFINSLEQEFDYLIFEIENNASDWSKLAARQSDQIIVVADAQTNPDSVEINAAICEGNMFSRLRKSLVLLHPPKAELPCVKKGWDMVLPFENIHPIRLSERSDIGRLTRFLSDRAIALVLGGGGARGLAHVGVIKALHEHNIPIDYVCGNSMGALVGAQYVFGTPVEKLVKTTQKFIKGGERPTVPLFSLLGGNRIRDNLHRMFEDINIEAMWRPFFAVSCNLSRAEINVHENGPLWEAVLASNSPAGILPPVIKNGDLLVDAALLDNVPVEPMRKRLRYGTLIAVDVDVSNEMTVANDITQFSKLRHLKQFMQKGGEKGQPGIFELINRSGHLGGLARRKIAKEMADYYLQPPVSDFSLMAYSRGEEIAETAYHYTNTHLKTWPEIAELQEPDSK